MLTRYLMPVLMLSFLAAPAAALAQGGAADTAEIRSYRLTMEKVRALTKVYESAQKHPQVRVLAAKEKELKALMEKDGPTAADERRMEKLEREIEEAESSIGSSLALEEGSLADMTRTIERSPILGPAVSAAGLKPREFAVLQLAFFQAMLAHSMQKAGQLKDLPKEVSAENVRFIAQHEAELQKLTQQLEKLGGGER